MVDKTNFTKRELHMMAIVGRWFDSGIKASCLKTDSEGSVYFHAHQFKSLNDIPKHLISLEERGLVRLEHSHRGFNIYITIEGKRFAENYWKLTIL